VVASPDTGELGARAARLAQAHWPILAVLCLGGMARAIYALVYRSDLPAPDSFLALADDEGEFLPDRPLPAEHLLGLITALLLYVILIRLNLSRWPAAAAALVVCLDGRLLALEYQPLEYPLFGCLVTLAILLLTLASQGDWRLAAAAGLTLAALALLRREGIFLAPVAIAYLVVVAFRRLNGSRATRPSGRSVGLRTAAVLALALSVSVALPLLAFSRVNAGELGFPGASDTDGWLFYGRVAPFGTCDAQVPGETAFLCEETPQRERNGPAFYVLDSRSPVRDSGPSGTSNEKVRDWALYVIRKQPLDYLGMIGEQFLRYLKPSDDYRPERIAWEDSLDTTSRGWDRLVSVRGPVVAILLAFALYGSLRSSHRRAEAALMTGFGLVLILVPIATVAFSWGAFLPALAPLVGAATYGACLLWSTALGSSLRELRPSAKLT